MDQQAEAVRPAGRGHGGSAAGGRGQQRKGIRELHDQRHGRPRLSQLGRAHGRQGERPAVWPSRLFCSLFGRHGRLLVTVRDGNSSVAALFLVCAAQVFIAMEPAKLNFGSANISKAPQRRSEPGCVTGFPVCSGSTPSPLLSRSRGAALSLLARPCRD